MIVEKYYSSEARPSDLARHVLSWGTRLCFAAITFEHHEDYRL